MQVVSKLFLLQLVNLFLYLWIMKSKKTKKSFFCTNLRIDEDLAKRVKASAEASKRSMNKEIEFVLEQKYFAEC